MTEILLHREKNRRMRPRFACILLAAGKSSRMLGQNKLLLKLKGESLVHRTARKITKVPFDQSLVITGHESDKVLSELHDFPVTHIYNAEFDLGMHSSIRAAMQNLDPAVDAFFVCLSDQPEFNFHNLEKMMAVFSLNPPDSIVYPVYKGQRGHPVLISSHYRDEILAEPDGDHGCAYLFKRHAAQTIEVEMEDENILFDIDSPEDYIKYETSYAP